MHVLIRNLELRQVEPQGDISTFQGLQAWLEDHLGFRWGQAVGINKKLIAGNLSVDGWYDQMNDMLLEGHANSWWIGRGFAGDASEFTEMDLLMGRAFRDADADYLIGFRDRIKDGKYQDENGDWMPRKLNANSRLYVGKMRGTTNESFVSTMPDDARWSWKLGATEEHCDECPQYPAIFDKVPRDELFTTPGSGDTPCLGNCLCYLDAVVGSVEYAGPRAVSLPFEDEEDEQVAA